MKDRGNCVAQALVSRANEACDSRCVSANVFDRRKEQALTEALHIAECVKWLNCRDG